MKNIQNLLQKAAFSLILSAICHLTIEGQEIIHEGFDNGTTAPPGWTIKAGGTYASATNSGAAIPSIKLSATGNYIETCDFKNANECSFWIKGVSIDTISALLVQCKSEGYWINLDSITNLTNSKKTLTYTLPDSSTKLRFTYYKSKGNLAFDDLIFKNSVPVKDTVPPAFIDNSPVLINKTDSSATYNINTDKPGTIFYFLTTPDFQSISLADLINQSGNVLKNGKIILINNTDTSITINGLEKNKKYCIHWVSSLSNEISLNSKITISKLSLLTDGCNLFFSEMIKGTGNNKAIEIFNPTGDTISFNNYRIAIASDGSGWKTSYYIFPKNAIIAPQDVFVIVKSNSDSIDLKLADALTNGTVVNFTGNDARGLQEVSENDSIWKFIDVFGDPNSSKNISIAGIEGAASNHSIIRKKYITHGDIDWTLSSGSSEKNSEWIISKLNDFSNLGKHNFQPIIKLKFDSIFFDYQEIPVFIDTISHSMTFTLHSIADINNLRLKYYIPDGIEIMPDPSTLNDYSKPVNFKLLNANNNDSIESGLKCYC